MGKSLRFLDLFSGIGGFRLGMEQAGHQCVGYVEKDKFARKSYEAIHDTSGEWKAHDIKSVTDDDIRFLADYEIDAITAGFPCQSFSVAGKRGGFKDTRGTLFFDIARFVKEIKPRYLLLENVRGILSSDKGKTWGTILNTLDELGVDCEWELLNSKDFGVPQNRERVFLVGHSRGFSRRKIFPLGRKNREAACDLVGRVDIKGKDQIKRVYGVEGISPTLTTMQGGHQEPKILVNQNRGQLVKRENNIANAVDANYYKGLDNHAQRSGVMECRAISTPDRVYKDQNGRRMKEHDEPMFTLASMEPHGVAIREATKKGYDIAHPGDCINYCAPTSQTRRGRVGKGVANTLDTGCQQGILTNDYRIRKLTPRECFRLQGFPDWAFDRANEVNSNSQLYKQAGNSVTVNVVYEIAKRLGGEDDVKRN